MVQLNFQSPAPSGCSVEEERYGLCARTRVHGRRSRNFQDDKSHLAKLREEQKRESVETKAALQEKLKAKLRPDIEGRMEGALEDLIWVRVASVHTMFFANEIYRTQMRVMMIHIELFMSTITKNKTKNKKPENNKMKNKNNTNKKKRSRLWARP